LIRFFLSPWQKRVASSIQHLAFFVGLKLTGRKKLVLVIMEHCPGCGFVDRDSRRVDRHFIHSNKCQYKARALAMASQLRNVEGQAELQHTLIPQLEPSTAVEEDVPHTSTRLPYTVPSPKQDSFGVPTLAGMSDLPGEQEHFGEHFGVEDDGFPLADDQMEYGDDSGDVDGNRNGDGDGDGDGGMEHGSSHVEASDDVVNDFASYASSVESEEDFDTALDATWAILQDINRRNDDLERDFQWEDNSSDMLEHEEKEDDGCLSDRSEEELLEGSALEQMDDPPIPADFLTGIEPPPPNQEDDDVQVEALLLALVQQFGCSLDGYQTIMEWAAFAQEKGYKFGRVERQKSRRAVMQRMIKRLDMECLKPISKTIPLVDDAGPDLDIPLEDDAGPDLDVSHRGAPASAPIPKKSKVVPLIPIVMYNFEDLHDSILKDKTLMVSENLLLNPENPWPR
jgi:hypothetical protein